MTTSLAYKPPSEYAELSLTATDIHNNGAAVGLVVEELSPNFAVAGSTVAFTGTPDRVEFVIAITATDQGASSYWNKPSLRVMNGAVIVFEVGDLGMQQNGAYSGDVHINGSFVDTAPGANPVYTFAWFDKDNRTATLIPEPFSLIRLSAVNL